MVPISRARRYRFQVITRSLSPPPASCNLQTRTEAIQAAKCNGSGSKLLVLLSDPLQRVYKTLKLLKKLNCTCSLTVC